MPRPKKTNTKTSAKLTAAKNEDVVQVELPAVHIKRVTIPVKGVTPLVVNNFHQKSLEQMAARQTKKATLTREAKDPQQCFERAKYKNAKGEDCVRSKFFKGAMVRAAKYVDGTNMTDLRMSVFVVGDYLPLEYEECVMDESMVRNANGNADIRYRPMYLNWKTEFTVEYRSNELSLSQVLLLVREAGLRVGICEGRPQKSPTLDWGRFDIDMEACAGRLEAKEAA